MRPSIRRRLLLWLSPTLLLAGVAFAVPTWFNVHEEIDELFDKVLRETAYSELNFAARSNSAISRPAPPTRTEGIDLISQEWDPKGRLLYRSHTFAPLPAPRGEGLSTVDWRGESWRVFNLKARHGLIQIAQAQSERRQTANEIALHLLMPLLFLLPGLALLVWFGIGRGLRPLQEIVDAVEQRTPDSLHPIPDRDLPYDVSTLVNALNGLLQRLDRALGAQRRFIADAAHELRTPLTALSLQAQVAERATDPKKRSIAIETLRQGISRASRLVQQLLTLSRLDPEAAEGPFASVRLDQVARAVVADQVPLAADVGIDLGIAATEPARVSGDGEALRILLANLIENAVRYTPAGGRVDVSVLVTNRYVRLEVSDSGPGIPPEAKSRAFDRFYRASSNTEPGTGLGLAIVKRIADRHGATIRLTDGLGGKGLRVSVLFAGTAL